MKGFDWTEISEALVIDIERDDDEAIAQDTVEAMLSSIGDDNQLADTVAIIRQYLTALAKETRKHHYDWPVWEGMLKIDISERGGQESLVKMTCELLRCMWS